MGRAISQTKWQPVWGQTCPSSEAAHIPGGPGLGGRLALLCRGVQQCSRVFPACSSSCGLGPPGHPSLSLPVPPLSLAGLSWVLLRNDRQASRQRLLTGPGGPHLTSASQMGCKIHTTRVTPSSGFLGPANKVNRVSMTSEAPDQALPRILSHRPMHRVCGHV